MLTPFIISCLLTLGFILWLLTPFCDDPLAESLSYRLPTLIGVIAVLGSFLWLPWLNFAPWQYARFVPDWAWDILPEVLRSLDNLLGSDALHRALSLLESFSALPGRWLIILIPTPDLWVRLVIGLPVMVAVLSMLWLLASPFIRLKVVTQFMGAWQVSSSFLAFVLLLLQVPNIDAWGTSGNFWLGLIALLTGAQMGFGVRASLAGLFFLILGGLREIERGRDVSPPKPLPYQPPEQEEAFPGWRRKALSFIGTILLLTSFFGMPWVQFGGQEYFDANLHWFVDQANLQQVVEVVPDQFPFLRWEPKGEQGLLRWFLGEPKLVWLVQRAQRAAHVTGWDLSVSPCPVSLYFRLALYLLLAVGIVTLIWNPISLADVTSKFHKVIAIGCGVIALVVLLFLFQCLPTIDTLGIRGDFKLSLLLLMAGAHVGWGVWFAFIGLALLIIGAILEAFAR